MRLQQGSYRNHIGIVGVQVPIRIDDSINRPNDLRRMIDLVHERNNRLFEGHRNGAPANTQGAHTRNSTLNIRGCHRLIQVIKAVFLIQVIVELNAVV